MDASPRGKHRECFVIPGPSILTAHSRRFRHAPGATLPHAVPPAVAQQRARYLSLDFIGLPKKWQDGRSRDRQFVTPHFEKPNTGAGGGPFPWKVHPRLMERSSQTAGRVGGKCGTPLRPPFPSPLPPFPSPPPPPPLLSFLPTILSSRIVNFLEDATRTCAVGTGNAFPKPSPNHSQTIPKPLPKS